MEEDAVVYSSVSKQAVEERYYSHLVPPQSAKNSLVTKWHTAARVHHFYQSAVDIVQEMWVRAVKFTHTKEFLAEFVGTFLLTVFGNGAIAQSVLSSGDFGSELSINIGYGIGLMFGAYAAIGVSGAHLNPAVTFGMALRGKVHWTKVPFYWIAQMLGAFVSSVILYGIYADAIHNFNCPEGINGTAKTPLCTGKIWATYPTPSIHLSLVNGFFDQVFGTFLLMFGIWAICDSENSTIKDNLKPIALGFLIWGIGLAFGFNCGYAINPARDFAPRIFTAMAGWGRDVFVCSEPCSIRHWWWVPLIAPMVGAAVATPCYWFLIEANHPAPMEEVKTRRDLSQHIETAIE